MKFHTDVMGDVTTNVGIISYDNKQGGRFGINLRYPQKFEFEEAIQRFTKEIKAYGFDLELESSTTSFCRQNDPFVQKIS